MIDSQYQDLGKDYLEHYGVLGMKWGVRRTPEQLGYKPKTSTEKWKAKKSKSISKVYTKKYKSLLKAEKEDPSDKSIVDYRKKLEKKQNQDLSKIKSMTYVDVQKERERESMARKAAVKKAAKIASKIAIRGAGMAMGISGLKEFSTLVEEIGNFRALSYQVVDSPIGRELVEYGDVYIKNFLRR